MLTITVPGVEMYDESSQEFVTDGDVVLELEHSLVSLSKWESIHEKPFLGGDKTPEDIFSYIKVMTLTPNVSEDVFSRLSKGNIEAINAHIDAKMSATVFFDKPGAPNTRETVTSELIYYWMTVFNIDFKCETWHLNRLFTLIRVCNLKQAKPKKMSRREIAERNRELNAQRKKKLGTTG